MGISSGSLAEDELSKSTNTVFGHVARPILTKFFIAGMSINTIYLTTHFVERLAVGGVHTAGLHKSNVLFATQIVHITWSLLLMTTQLDFGKVPTQGILRSRIRRQYPLMDQASVQTLLYSQTLCLSRSIPQGKGQQLHYRPLEITRLGYRTWLI